MLLRQQHPFQLAWLVIWALITRNAKARLATYRHPTLALPLLIAVKQDLRVKLGELRSFLLAATPFTPSMCNGRPRKAQDEPNVRKAVGQRMQIIL